MLVCVDGSYLRLAIVERYVAGPDTEWHDGGGAFFAFMADELARWPQVQRDEAQDVWVMPRAAFRELFARARVYAHLDSQSVVRRSVAFVEEAQKPR